jgi:anti-anti-sigma regulatory factor
MSVLDGHGRGPVVLDLTRLTPMDADGFRVLRFTRSRLARRGHSVLLRTAPAETGPVSDVVTDLRPIAASIRTDN